MKFLGLEIGGPLIIEHIEGGLSAWTINDKGRLIWDVDNEKFYFGATSGWAEVKSSDSITLGGDSPGDMYYRNSSILNRLIKGSANQKLFMNLLGTIPEWANDSYVTSVEFDMSTADETSTSITGVGFKPSSIICFASNKSNSKEFSCGFADTTTGVSIYRNYLLSNYMYYALSTFAMIRVSAGYQSFAIDSFDNDGFTFKNYKSSTPTDLIELQFLCFR